MAITDRIINENGGKLHYNISDIVNILMLLAALGLTIYAFIDGGVVGGIIAVLLYGFIYGICFFVLKCIDALVFKIRGH